MTIQQLPDFAFRSVGDYTTAMDGMHELYDPLFGSSGVALLERLGVFQVFRSVWFSAGLLVLVTSIVVCTLDRTPRLWREVSDVRVAQPDAFFDPALADRAAMGGVDASDIRETLGRRGFRVREETSEDGTHFLYGDRHQYTKMATLLTHLGLILFLVAAAVTAAFGEEQGLVVPEGESLTVQPIGTPGLLLVKNHRFDAPGMETGQATDFVTDLAVYQDGAEIARKEIRVNDPLSVGGYTFHQNGFGAAPHLTVHDGEGRPLWDGPVPLTDSARGVPYGILAVPGRDIGLQLLLSRTEDGVGVVLVLPYRVLGVDAEGRPVPQNFEPFTLVRGDTAEAPGLDLSVGLESFTEYTLLIAKKDPGQGLVWLAFGSLITGLAITFYLPRRRVWARLDQDGGLRLTWRSDRYVDVEREFGRLLDDLVGRRRTA